MHAEPSKVWYEHCGADLRTECRRAETPSEQQELYLCYRIQSGDRVGICGSHGYEGTVKDAIRPVGTSRTDIFYRSETIAQAFQNLYKEFQKPKEKDHLICTDIPRSCGEGKTPDCFDLEKFAEHFKDEYVVIFKHHPLVKNVPQIPEELNGTFAIDATKP